MTDIPIIFSAPMVRALLTGRKTMTRRLAWREPLVVFVTDGKPDPVLVPTPWQKVKPGDRLWVREAWAPVNSFHGPGWGYRADEAFIQPKYDGPDEGNGPSFNYTKYPGSYAMWFNDLLAGAPDHRWTPGIHMPRWASRLTLAVTATKIERLQDISEADAKAEGVERDTESCDHKRQSCEDIGCLGPTHKASFCDLWCRLHSVDSWQANPEVVALTFTVQRANIDQIERKVIAA